MERGIVGVFRITLNDCDDRSVIDESSEVVYVAVGVVAGDAILQPKNVFDTEIILENFGVVFAAKAGITFLGFTEKTFFRGEQRAETVDVDASAFENDASSVMLRLPEAALELLVCSGNNCGVSFVIFVFGPSVEPPVRVGDYTGRILYTDGSRVAHPSAISGNPEEIYCGEIGAGFLKDSADSGFGFFIFNQKIDALDLRQVTNDFREGPWDGRKFSRPVG